ncbi:hypothetical protein JCM10207_004920 [Rhodosporidiobolus poonsookiae]
MSTPISFSCSSVLHYAPPESCNRAYHGEVSHPFFKPFCSGTWTVDCTITGLGTRKSLATLDGLLSWRNCREPVELLNGTIENCAGEAYGVTFDLKIDEKETDATGVRCANFDIPPGPPLKLTFSNKRHLWVTSSLLSEISPYWQTRLASTDFDDSSGGAESSSDSDVEADEMSKPDDPTSTSNDPPSPTGRELGISHASYTAYRAFLCYTQGVEPVFAPLVSSYRSASTSEEAARKLRLAQLKEYHTTFPSLPLPRAALDGLKARLDPAHVAYELFSPFAQTYDEVAKVELEFALEHKEEVRGSRALEEVVREVEGEEPGGDRKGMLLALKLLRGKQ